MRDRRNGDRVRIGGGVTVDADESLAGDVVAVGGPVRIEGQVRGDVVAVGGGVTLGPRAVVDGDVTAVGGPLHRDPGAIVRGTLLGSALGILPGGGAVISSFLSYALEKKVSRHPEEFGKGAIEGVAAPESANNAATASGFVPLLTLGLPANVVMALMLAGGVKLNQATKAGAAGSEAITIARETEQRGGETQPLDDKSGKGKPFMIARENEQRGGETRDVKRQAGNHAAIGDSEEVKLGQGDVAA